MGWKYGWIALFCLGLGACAPGDDSGTGPTMADDGCTGAACCEGGCPSSSEEGDVGESAGTMEPGGDECDGGACCDSDCGEDEADSGVVTGGGVAGTCRTTCQADVDCCPGKEACGVSCVAGVCVPTPCAPGSCGPMFQYDTECHELDGHAVCLPVCNENCGQPNSGEGCFGVADDDYAYCLEPCFSDFIGGCAPGQTCDEVTGRCVCTADDQCQEGQVCDPT